jgi:cyclopropane-fatty-acyl-phospholipid synthase
MIKNKVPLDEFIQHSLYDKNKGYYMKNNPIGVNADFITAPEISVLFSEMIAIWLVGFWEKLGKPDNINIIELGAGTGELMFQINNTIKNFVKFKKSCNFYILEKSPKLIEIQKEKNQPFKIKWIDDLKKIKNFPSIIIANEFFDALPVKQFKKINKIWFEQYVKKNNKTYQFTDKKIRVFQIENLIGQKISKSQRFIEVSPESIEKINEISKIIKKNNGGILIIDYGNLDSNMSNTIQSVKKHKKTDILKNIYKSDITHLLNFQFYKRKFKKKLDEVKITTQREFLVNMGILERAEILSKNLSFSKKTDLYYRIQRLIDNREMGKLFKVMFVTRKKNKFKMGFE